LGQSGDSFFQEEERANADEEEATVFRHARLYPTIVVMLAARSIFSLTLTGREHQKHLESVTETGFLEPCFTRFFLIIVKYAIATRRSKPLF
jgi:hypothetical protein